MRAFLTVLGLFALASCHNHDHEGDRDTKGRSTAIIGGPATTTAAAALSVAPPVLVADDVTVAWTGTISESTGAAPPVGTTCTLTTHATDARKHDALALVCGKMTLFDQSDPVDGPSQLGYAIYEYPVAGEVSTFTYELNATDKGARTGRNQITVDTYRGKLTAFRQTIPTFSVSIAVAPKRDARTGRPLLAGNVPAFDAVAKAKATMTASTGPLPFTGKSCELRISPGDARHNCRAQLECAKKIVYGVGTGGYTTCTLRDGKPVSFSDQKPTPVDNDPALTADLDAKTATFADEPKGGAPFSASFTLAPE